MNPASCLYRGEVFHKRFKPRVHSLKYQVFSLFVDLEDLPTLSARSRWFSHNRFNLLSFYDADVGRGGNETLREYVSSLLGSAELNPIPETICLSCYPRVLGYSFNPLSLFYCYNSEGDLYAIVHEVHNTFGERHAYVLPCDVKTLQGAETWIHQRAEKELFVSPFAHMDMRYRFRVNVPGAHQLISIQTHDNKSRSLVLTAGYSAKRQEFSDGNLLRLFLHLPALCIKVVAGIHWEALKLFVKRIPLFKHQPKAI
ncbi:MAG: DUF1365 domain-containing protein [Gammaproteobacteria bacterium]|nr:DUF1365 domain-containing protein [Gammaproteobacteria bacterium]